MIPIVSKWPAFNAQAHAAAPLSSLVPQHGVLSLLQFLSTVHFHCSVRCATLLPAFAEPPVSALGLLRLERTRFLPKVSQQVSLGSKIGHRSFLLSFSGCLFSSGPLHGMGEIKKEDQTRDPDLKDD